MKKQLIISFLCLLLFSCKSHFISNYKDSNRLIVHHNEPSPRLNFYNSSLAVSMDLYGCSSLGDDNNVIDRKQYRFYRKLIRKNFPEARVSRDNFVYRASRIPGIYPSTHSVLFKFPENIGEPGFLVDSIRLSTLSLVQCNDRQFLWIYTLDKKHNKTSLPLLIRRANELHETIRCDDGYVRAAPIDPFQMLRGSFSDSANYLSPIFLASQIESQYCSESDRWNWLQAALTFNSFVLNNRNFHKLQSTLYRSADSEIKSHFLNNDALAYIKEQISGQRLILMNEQHWQPKHRFLGNVLLQTLYDAEFRYLAVEAVWENTDVLNDRGYPLQETGFYISEPQFGNFMRNALNMGFKIIPYDAFSGDRSRKQAENIYKNTFKIDSVAKVFVWAGIGHVFKNKSENPRMGRHLWEMSGIEPFVIAQAGGDVRSQFLGEHFLAVSANPNNNYERGDLYLYNNFKESDFQIIPGAMEEKVNIVLSELAKSKIDEQEKLLLMVFIKDEFERHRFNAVPVINYLLDDNKHQPVIRLPKGSYTAIVRTRYLSIIEQFDINIE